MNKYVWGIWDGTTLDARGAAVDHFPPRDVPAGMITWVLVGFAGHPVSLVGYKLRGTASDFTKETRKAITLDAATQDRLLKELKVVYDMLMTLVHVWWNREYNDVGGTIVSSQAIQATYIWLIHARGLIIAAIRGRIAGKTITVERAEGMIDHLATAPVEIWYRVMLANTGYREYWATLSKDPGTKVKTDLFNNDATISDRTVDGSYPEITGAVLPALADYT